MTLRRTINFFGYKKVAKKFIDITLVVGKLLIPFDGKNISAYSGKYLDHTDNQ